MGGLHDGYLGSTFGGIKIYESPYLPDDTILAFNDLAETSGVTAEKMAEFGKLMDKHINGQIEKAILGDLPIGDNITDPEKEAMQNNEMWGVF